MAKSLFAESANKSDDSVKVSKGAGGSQKEDLHSFEPERIGANDEHVAVKDRKHDSSRKEDDMNTKTHDESEGLSDIDDWEVDRYIHNEEEKNYKKIIWENMNREYLEEQAVKKAGAAVQKSRKELKRKQAQEAKNSGPEQTLKTKRLSSRVNYDRLEKLLDEPGGPEKPKKVRFETPSDKHDNSESNSEHKMDDDELGSANDVEDGNIDGEEYENTMYHENAYETFDYEDDGYNNEDDCW